MIHRVAASLIEGASSRAEVEGSLGDGAYDSSEIYELLERRGIEAVIKPKGNARSDTGSLSRSVAVGLIMELGYESWAETVGYGRRWAVETAYSSFKRLFGECALGRRLDSISVELALKVMFYNRLVNM
jgi:hypothetical protein